jgi:hypothetical protein
MDPTAGRKRGGQHRGIPPGLAICWLCAPYVLSMCSEVDRIHLGAHREQSRSNQGEFRRYAGAASLPTIRVCIYEAEH